MLAAFNQTVWRATESHQINENSLFFLNVNFQSICPLQIFLFVLATILTQKFVIKKNLRKMSVLLFSFDWDQNMSQKNSVGKVCAQSFSWFCIFLYMVQTEVQETVKTNYWANNFWLVRVTFWARGELLTTFKGNHSRPMLITVHCCSVEDHQEPDWE